MKLLNRISVARVYKGHQHVFVNLILRTTWTFEHQYFFTPFGINSVFPVTHALKNVRLTSSMSVNVSHSANWKSNLTYLRSGTSSRAVLLANGAKHCFSWGKLIAAAALGTGQNNLSWKTELLPTTYPSDVSSVQNHEVTSLLKHRKCPQSSTMPSKLFIVFTDVAKLMLASVNSPWVIRNWILHSSCAESAFRAGTGVTKMHSQQNSWREDKKGLKNACLRRLAHMNPTRPQKRPE